VGSGVESAGTARGLKTVGTADFRDMTQALYRAVSAAPEHRDWEVVRHHYHPQARLVRTGLDADGSVFARVMSLGEYIENVDTLLKDVQFSEVELSHEAVVFGNVARVTSVYGYTWRSASEQREGRGVNFFTLIHDGVRWQIMSIVWDNERPGLSLADAGLA
jgi:hypothetical protein